MANYYWVGGNNNWTNTSADLPYWRTISGTSSFYGNLTAPSSVISYYSGSGTPVVGDGVYNNGVLIGTILSFTITSPGAGTITLTASSSTSYSTARMNTATKTSIPAVIPGSADTVIFNYYGGFLYGVNLTATSTVQVTSIDASLASGAVLYGNTVAGYRTNITVSGAIKWPTTANSYGNSYPLIINLLSSTTIDNGGFTTIPPTFALFQQGWIIYNAVSLTSLPSNILAGGLYLSGTGTMNLGSATYTVGSFSSTQAITAGTSTIKIIDPLVQYTDATILGGNFVGGGRTYYNLIADSVFINDSGNVFNNFTILKTPGRNAIGLVLPASATLTVNKFTMNNPHTSANSGYIQGAGASSTLIQTSSQQVLISGLSTYSNSTYGITFSPANTFFLVGQDPKLQTTTPVDVNLRPATTPMMMI
jgi:hypothetical protein